MVRRQIASHAELLEHLDGDDRITRKRIEKIKEKLQAKLEGLATRKDDMLTIAEIGIDQLIVDEAQEFRKLTFATNMTNLKGVQPDGSQRAWDLYVKSRFVATINPGRALVMASGTPITNTLAEMYTLQRYMQEDALLERNLHAFDAWASTFGDSRTELELQPSGLYKPVTRFAEFINVADLMAMFRSFADVVGKDDLRGYLRLPRIETGRRQIVTAEPSPTFRWYQRVLARRIERIEARKRRPEKGDDILLSVITDGRHAAIDLRFVLEEYEDEEANKLNALIGNVHRIWAETREQRYLRPDGERFPIPGAAQMVFSDLGTLSVEAARGFSAYRWIRDQLVARGVPASEIAFMQDYKKSAAKQRLFGDVNAGRVRILLGSSETMGTGVNAQLRLKALHHLDVPWLPSHIEQREGRIERQGNQNEEIGIYAYATLGSTDATMWQNNERKQRFINAAMSGDRSVRRIEDAGSQVSQFAMAKAIASGDPRLMQKAGLEAEVARLERQAGGAHRRPARGAVRHRSCRVLHPRGGAPHRGDRTRHPPPAAHARRVVRDDRGRGILHGAEQGRERPAQAAAQPRRARPGGRVGGRPHRRLRDYRVRAGELAQPRPDRDRGGARAHRGRAGHRRAARPHRPWPGVPVGARARPFRRGACRGTARPGRQPASPRQLRAAAGRRVPAGGRTGREAGRTGRPAGKPSAHRQGRGGR